MQGIDSLQNLFQHESPALKELQFKLLHKSKLEEVMSRMLKTQRLSANS